MLRLERERRRPRRCVGYEVVDRHANGYCIRQRNANENFVHQALVTNGQCGYYGGPTRVTQAWRSSLSRRTCGRHALCFNDVPLAGDEEFRTYPKDLHECPQFAWRKHAGPPIGQVLHALFRNTKLRGKCCQREAAFPKHASYDRTCMCHSRDPFAWTRAGRQSVAHGTHRTT